jgi:predicted patatin/cPLA2 family phospholipase
MKKKKINRILICDGGGMQGSFMVGIFKYFNKYGIKPDYFDYIVGTSVGAYDACYWATGQFEEGLRIWEKRLPNGFIKWNKFIPKVYISYLKKIITKLEPLDIKKLRTLKTKIYMPLSNSKTQRVNFIYLNKTQKPVDALLAGAAMPFFSHYKIFKNKRYYDGGLISQPSLDFAKKLKPKEIWILLTYPKGYRMSKWLYVMVAKLL